MKEQFIFFEESWNESAEDTKAQPKDDYGDTHIDGVDEYFPNAPRSSTIED
jgi:hypothetical protein